MQVVLINHFAVHNLGMALRSAAESRKPHRDAPCSRNYDLQVVKFEYRRFQLALSIPDTGYF
jgi:hypothetical protein